MNKRSGTAIDLLEQGVHLLRKARGDTLLCYYVGSVPFVLCALYYWADMSRGAFARERAASGAFILALVFVWMKYCQSRFCLRLRRQISSVSPHSDLADSVDGFAARFRQALTQTVIHTTGIFAIPIAILLSLPFGWTYAFYQNATVLADSNDFKDVVRKAWKQALLWPKQNHVVIWLISPMLLCIGAAIWLIAFPILASEGSDLSMAIAYAIGFVLAASVLLLNPFGVIVGANIGLALVVLPELLRMFFGIETSFTRSGEHMLNSTLFAVVCGLTYLCLDPLIKAVYTLRCFYGQSLSTGADLLVELRQIRRMSSASAVLVLLGFLLSAQTVRAAESSAQAPPSSSETAISPDQLDHSIRNILDDPEFSWRIPRDAEIDAGEPEGPVASFFYRVRQTLEGWAKSLSELVKRFFRWLRDVFNRRAAEHGETNWSWLGSIESLLWLLVIVLAALLVLLIWRLRKRPKMSQLEIYETKPAAPDLAQENVSAALLPEDSWLTLARELMSKGEFRLALRAFYLASLAHLADRGFVSIATFKSNREYERELTRRAHALPNVRELFAVNVAIFDRVWYGEHPIDESLLNGFAANVEKINAC